MASKSLTTENLYATTRWSLTALINSLTNAYVSDWEEPDEGKPWWGINLISDRETATLSWRVAYDGEKFFSISRTVSFVTESAEPMSHTVPLQTFEATSESHLSQTIINAIIGRTSIPMSSRKEASDVARVAAEDANYVYRTAVNSLIHSGEALGVGMDDDVAVWEELHAVAERVVGHRLARHKEQWRAVGVPFDSSDVYDDTFWNAAHELTHSLLGRRH